MNIRTAPVDTLCDALLDGDLNEQDRWSVGRRMLGDPELSEAVEQHQRIRESIGRRFEVPDLGTVFDQVARQVELASAGQVSGAVVADGAAFANLPGVHSNPRAGTRLLMQCAAAVLVFCMAMWPLSSDPVTPEGPGSAVLIRQIESNLTDAVALGVAGAAAMVGSRRLMRGRKGRFILERTGLRLILPAETEEAIALHTGAIGQMLVYRTSNGVRAVTIMEKVEAAEIPGSDRIHRRGLGDLVLFEIGDREPASLPDRFDLQSSDR